MTRHYRMRNRTPAKSKPKAVTSGHLKGLSERTISQIRSLVSKNKKQRGAVVYLSTADLPFQDPKLLQAFLGYHRLRKALEVHLDDTQSVTLSPSITKEETEQRINLILADVKKHKQAKPIRTNQVSPVQLLLLGGIKKASLTQGEADSLQSQLQPQFKAVYDIARFKIGLKLNQAKLGVALSSFVRRSVLDHVSHYLPAFKTSEGISALKFYRDVCGFTEQEGDSLIELGLRDGLTETTEEDHKRIVSTFME